MKKYENFRSMEVFQFTPRKFVIQTWLCICPQYLCLFHIVFECTPDIHDQGKMLVLPNRLLMSSTYTDKNNPFYGVRISIPNWKPSPNRAAIGFSQIAFPITVLPKDDRKDCAQEERLGLPYWTMI